MSNLSTMPALAAPAPAGPPSAAPPGRSSPPDGDPFATVLDQQARTAPAEGLGDTHDGRGATAGPAPQTPRDGDGADAGLPAHPGALAAATANVAATATALVTTVGGAATALVTTVGGAATAPGVTTAATATAVAGTPPAAAAIAVDAPTLPAAATTTAGASAPAGGTSATPTGAPLAADAAVPATADGRAPTTSAPSAARPGGETAFAPTQPTASADRTAPRQSGGGPTLAATGAAGATDADVAVRPAAAPQPAASAAATPAAAGTGDALAGGASTTATATATAPAAPGALGQSMPAADLDASGRSAGLARGAVPLDGAVETVRLAMRAASERGVSHARISLSPQELGGIEIHLRHTADGLIAKVIADSGGAAQLLQQSAADLRRQLEQQGLTLLQLDVGASGEQAPHAPGGHGAGDASRDGRPGGRDGAVGDGEATIAVAREGAAERAPLALSNGALVDVLA